MEYKKELQNNYLILEASEVKEDEDYGLQMVQQNQVKGLLPMHASRMDGVLYLNYEITSRQTLESLYEKKVMGYQDILFIFSSIYDTLEEMRKYLLSWQRILFAPELIYTLPERRGLLLCFYATENEYPVSALAEFILKRLDHRDRQAVALGYGFYQQISEANFSLAKTLKEMLAGVRESGPGKKRKQEAGRLSVPGEMSEAYAAGGYGRQAVPDGMGGASAMRGFGRQAVSDGIGSASAMRGYDRQAVPNSMGGASAMREPGWEAVPDGVGGAAVMRGYGREAAEAGMTGSEAVNRNDRRLMNGAGEKKAGRNLADRFFSRVHPAVMLSFLLFMVVLELLILFGILGPREAGGCFFLGLSVGVLINRRILHKNHSEPKEWEDEEEDEEYQKILREVYQAEAEPETNYESQEETCYLNSGEGEKKWRLICVSSRVNSRAKPCKPLRQQGADDRMGNPAVLPEAEACGADRVSGNGEFPDVHLGEDPLYIGKIRGEADILLNVSTVSRMHARLEVRENVCYLRDMNSKNGTFVNGRRLHPQEECELQAEDTVAFAEVEYRVEHAIV